MPAWQTKHFGFTLTSQPSKRWAIPNYCSVLCFMSAGWHKDREPQTQDTGEEVKAVCKCSYAWCQPTALSRPPSRVLVPGHRKHVQGTVAARGKHKVAQPKPAPGTDYIKGCMRHQAVVSHHEGPKHRSSLINPIKCPRACPQAQTWRWTCPSVRWEGTYTSQSRLLYSKSSFVQPRSLPSCIEMVLHGSLPTSA